MENISRKIKERFFDKVDITKKNKRRFYALVDKETSYELNKFIFIELSVGIFGVVTCWCVLCYKQ